MIRIYKIRAFSTYYCLLIAFSLIPILNAQDSISIEDIREHSYNFNLEDGNFVGKGASILNKAVEQSHVTLLADNNRSELEYLLTDAFIKLLDKNDYKNLALEFGPASGELLNRIFKPTQNAASQVKELNKTYTIELKNNVVYPIPDLKYQEAVGFIQTAIVQDWSISSIGVDIWTSYEMIIDELYNNLTKKKQSILQEDYLKVSRFVKNLYAKIKNQTHEDVMNLCSSIQESKLVQKYLSDANTNEANQKLIEGLKFSAKYWKMWGNKQFYIKNELSSARNKKLIKAQLSELDFDFSKDKLFVKMYRNHLSRGITMSGFFGVGNMLNELSNYHGNETLNIVVSRRYYLQNNELKDIMSSDDHFSKEMKAIIALGNQNEWTLIDLRTLNEKLYSASFVLSKTMRSIIDGYDLLIIPPTDKPGTELN